MPASPTQAARSGDSIWASNLSVGVRLDSQKFQTGENIVLQQETRFGAIVIESDFSGADGGDDLFKNETTNNLDGVSVDGANAHAVYDGFAASDP